MVINILDVRGGCFKIIEQQQFHPSMDVPYKNKEIHLKGFQLFM